MDQWWTTTVKQSVIIGVLDVEWVKTVLLGVCEILLSVGENAGPGLGQEVRQAVFHVYLGP